MMQAAGAGFTPGPWSASGTTVWGSDGGARNTVADTTCCGSLTREQDEANATLIAAAPDLYAALERVIAFVDYGTIQNTTNANVAMALDSARAALDKARSDK
jgi:hypothetical protein